MMKILTAILLFLYISKMYAMEQKPSQQPTAVQSSEARQKLKENTQKRMFAAWERKQPPLVPVEDDWNDDYCAEGQTISPRMLDRFKTSEEESAAGKSEKKPNFIATRALFGHDSDEEILAAIENTKSNSEGKK